MNIRSKQPPNCLSICCQRLHIYIQTSTHEKPKTLLLWPPHFTFHSLHVSALSAPTGSLLLILSSVISVLISAAVCHRVSLSVNLLQQLSDSDSLRPSFHLLWCLSVPMLSLLFLVWLYLHASPCDLEYVSHAVGWVGREEVMENNFTEGAERFLQV